MNITCIECSREFSVTSQDRPFYETMGVPTPTRCPKCRHQLRCAYRNEATLYNRSCSKCHKAIVSMYSEDKPFPVYCLACYYADDFNPLDFGQPFDFDRPFFEQFVELRNRVPRIALLNDTSSENSDYTNHVYGMKDCYLVSDATDDERLLYCNGVNNVRDSMDCSYMSEHTELCYESLYIEKGYNLQYCNDCVGCRDSYFLKDCSGVSNSFMCVGLRNVEYHFKNEKFTKEAYEQKIAAYDLSSRSGVAKARQEFEEFVLTVPHKYYHGVNNEQSSGDHIRNNNRVRHSFETRRVENGAYLFGVFDAKDCMDMMVFGAGAERVYMGQAIGGGVYNIIAGNVVWLNSKNLYYCDNILLPSEECFGSISLKKSKHVLLNQQYSQAEYEELLPKVIEHMKQTGEWGEYFPKEHALFAYNESDANEFFPLTKEQATEQGWRWQENLPGTFGNETLTEIPDSIQDCADSITHEILACRTCERNYKIMPQELVFYRKQSIPIPDTCPKCRRNTRLLQRPPFQLWQRQCMNAECNNTFETTYSPERKEIVYCEECYNKEIY